MNIEIKKFDYVTREERSIRTRVFVEEQGFIEEFDGIDDTSHHLLLYLDGQVAACCRFFSGTEEGVYILGRLAVLKAFRGKQLASRLISSVKEQVIALGGHSIELHAQVQAQAFYEKNGYHAFREPDEEEGVPHVWMKCSF